MTVEELVERIAKYIAENSESESIFLTPNPYWSINSHDLMDFISETSGVSKEQIGEWVEEAR